MSASGPLRAEQQILRHTAAQAALIILAGVLWYIVWLAAMATWPGQDSSPAHRGVAVPGIDPTTVLALLGVALAIGAFGQQARTTSMFDRFRARADTGAAQLTAVIATAVAIAALVHTQTEHVSAQARQLSIGGVALAVFLAWRVSSNRLRIEFDGRAERRARSRAQLLELRRLCSLHATTRRSVAVTLMGGLVMCAATLVAVLTSVRLLATGQVRPGPDLVASLEISAGTIAATLVLRTIYLLARTCDAAFMQYLIATIACATPIVTTVGVVSATLHRPAALLAGLALVLAIYLPSAFLCLVRPLGGATVYALTLRIVRGCLTRRAAAHERLIEGFEAMPD